MNIDSTLQQAPATMAELAIKAEKVRFLWKTAEIKQKQEEAKKALALKAMSEEKISMAELKVQVDADDEVYNSRLEVIKLESTYKKAVIEFEKWSNAFTSARKLANIRIEEMRSLNDTVTNAISGQDRRGVKGG